MYAYEGAGSSTKSDSLTFEPSTFGKELPSGFATAFPLKVAEPYNACSPLSEDDTYAGHAVLIRRGDCFFTDKVAAAHDRGAAFVIIVNTAETTLQMGAPDGLSYAYSDLSPSVIVKASTGRLLYAIATDSEGGYLSIGLHAPEAMDDLLPYRDDDAVESPSSSRNIGQRAWAVQFNLVIAGDGKLQILGNDEVYAITSTLDIMFQNMDSVSSGQRAELLAGSFQLEKSTQFLAFLQLIDSLTRTHTQYPVHNKRWSG